MQIDDTNFAHMCDPKFHDRYRRIGEDPDTLPGFYAQMINACIRNRPAGQRVGLHMCRGNVRGAWVAEGGYEPVAQALLNELEVDCLFMEYDAPRPATSPLFATSNGTTSWSCWGSSPPRRRHSNPGTR